MIRFIFYLYLSRIIEIETQETGIGPCPHIMAMNDFDIDKFSGLWYEIARNPNFYELRGTCPYIRISNNGTRSMIIQRQLDMKTNTLKSINGSGVYPIATVGKIQIDFLNSTHDYNVLKTDYENYAAVYSCIDYLVFHLKFMYIYSKNKSLEFIAQVKSVFKEAGLSPNKIRTTDQNGCFIAESDDQIKI